MWRVDLKIENRTMRGPLSLREARANVAEIKDLCLGHVTLRTLRPLLKKIQGHWHTNGVISITRVSLLARWVEPVRSMLEKKLLIWPLFFLKGQLNSEWIYEVIVLPTMPTKNCKDFCPTKQARIVALFWVIFWWVEAVFLAMILVWLVWPKSLKILVGILGETMKTMTS